MYIEKFRLDKKTAVITGGSRGIGREIALAFAEAGANVVVASRKLPDLEAVTRDIEARGGKAHAVSAHMGKSEDIRRLIDQAVGVFGGIDILVNNAAINPQFGPIERVDEELFDKMIDINLKAALLLSQMAMPIMEKRGGGAIINISSVEGFKPAFGTGIYSVTKAALIMLTKSMALEWAPHKIRVNCIAPGLIKTHFSELLWSSDAALDYFMGHCPLKRVGEPGEIASIALLLASEAAGYTTGAVFTADGGYLI